MKNQFNNLIIHWRMLLLAGVLTFTVISLYSVQAATENNQKTCFYTKFDHYFLIHFKNNQVKNSVENINNIKPKELVSNIKYNLPAISAKNRLALLYVDSKNPDKIVNTVITAYTSTPDQTDNTPFIAASGKKVYDGMIAANWLPFGTKVKIPELYGDKLFTVYDRMNKRYGYGRMDIWLDETKTEARKFGVKRVKVEIYYQNKNTKKLTIAK